MMKKAKLLVLWKSFLWCILVLLFPIISGVLSVILSLDSIKTLFLQGAFMLMALIPPVILVSKGKWRWHEIGFGKLNVESCKKAWYFAPVIAMFIPIALKGFYLKSVGYVLGCLFLYLAVGIAEELYFRGIIPQYLRKEFSFNTAKLLSIFIFGIGHLSTALIGSTGFETFLTVLNALIFGWLAIEIFALSKNILPTIAIHFFFDFETKIAVISGSELLIAECVRGTIMFLIALWLSSIQRKIKVDL